MATGAAITNYIDLTNFTPGIASGWGGIATPGDGTTAQIAETWGCFGLPEGGLGPLPRLKSTITGSPMATVTAPPADYSTDLRIHDILAVPNFRTPNTAGSAEWHDSTLSTREQDMVMVVVEKFATVSGVTRKLMTGHLYNAQTNSWESDSTELVIRADADGTISNTWGSGAALAIRASPGATNQISNPSAQAFDVDSSRYQSILISWHTSWNYNWLFAGVGFFTDPVYGYKLGAGSGVENDIWEGGTYMWDNLARYTYPHASPPTTFNGWPMGVSRAFYHQGRLCYPASKLARGGNIFTNRPEGIYGDGAWARSWDDTTLVFHAPKGPQSLDGDDLAGGIVLNTHSPGIIGAITSLNSSQLLAIHSSSGGMLVSGDLATTGQVTAFRQVESTGYNPHTPTVGPMGMVYGSPNGVFAWSGSDVSQCISPLLDGQFWTPEWAQDWGSGRQPWTPLGRFEYRYPFLFAPYNWVMDTRSGGWFRIFPTAEQDPVNGRDIMNWAAGTENMWGSLLQRPKTGTSSTDDLYLFDLSAGAHEFQWRSQPIMQGRGRITRARELVLVAQGTGTIIIQLDGVDGSTGSHTFTVDSPDKPYMMRAPINVDAHDLTVLISATGDAEDTETPAPTIHRLSIGVQTRESSSDRNPA